VSVLDKYYGPDYIKRGEVIMKIPVSSYVLLMASFFMSELWGAKIVGLVGVRNEEIMIEQFLRALSLYADAIIILDDASTDNTVQIIESLQTDCKVEKIIKKNSWFRDEPGDRNALLDEGRKIGGTHFIIIDADEMFTANCLQDNILKNHILELNPGESLALNWLQLWRSVDRYRYDSSVWTNNYNAMIFCDDGISRYSSDFIHTPRIPRTINKKYHRLDDTMGLLHFQFVNWQNLLIKQSWYRCLEHIRDPQKSIFDINTLYGHSKDESNIGFKECPKEWFSGYTFFNPSIFNQSEKWRKAQVSEWFKQYGKGFFKDLDIWDVNWDGYVSQSGQDKFVIETVFRGQKNGVFVEIGAFDGIRFSNTYNLETDYNWSGLCIEPIPEQFEKLIKNRNCHCVQACVSNFTGKAPFLCVDGYSDMLSGLVNEYDPRHVARIQKESEQYNCAQKFLTVDCFCLNDLLKKYNLYQVDYLSIDTEGGEENILEAIDYDTFDITVIGVENNYNTSRVRDFLTQKGYCYIATLGADDFFVKN
jgi:FkbM family methyltransferase